VIHTMSPSTQSKPPLHASYAINLTGNGIGQLVRGNDGANRQHGLARRSMGSGGEIKIALAREVQARAR
jgi:hypothetical protein